MRKIYEAIKTTYKKGKFLFLVYIVISLITFFLSYVDIYFFKLLLSELIEGEFTKAWYIVIILLSSVFFGIILKYVTDWTKKKIKYNTNKYYDNKYLLKLTTIEFSHIEDNDLQQSIHLLKVSISRTIDYSLNFIAQIIGFSFFIYYSYMILKFNALAGIIFIAGMIPSSIFSSRMNELYWNKYQEMVPDIRKMSYYRWMLTDNLAIRDIKTYNSYEDIGNRYFEEKKKYFSKKKKADRYVFKISTFLSLFPILPLVFIMFTIVSEGVQGKLSISEVQMYISVAVLMYIYIIRTVKIIFGDVKVFKISIDVINEFFSINDESGERMYVLDEMQSIEFDSVFFKYPNCKTDVLKNLSFVIKKGDKVCLLGVNGAGKTTIIKLLLGLYKPRKGRILINNIELSNYNIDSVRRKIGVLFQEYGKYSLNLRESVSLSDVSRITEDKQIRKSLKKVNLGAKFDNQSLDINLTKQFDNEGTELSGGEWQKIALSRLDFGNYEIIVLDEPSSALDPEAEDKLFEEYTQLSAKKTVLMISHRIFIGKMATKIMLLKGGKITEQGSHDELMKHNGDYNEFFSFQLNRFRGTDI